MMFQIKRCPHCGKVYESGLYREKIGKPIVMCLFCMKPVLDKNTNEWQLLGIFGKLGYIIFVLMSIFVTGLLSGMLALLVLLLPDIYLKTRLSSFIISDEPGGNGLIIFGAVFMALTTIYILVREGRDISASNARMKDPEYRNLLETAGLLKK